MTLLDTLRSATTAAHRRLETRLALLDPTITLDRYRRVLEALWGYHAPLEVHLEQAKAWEAVGLEGPPRRRAPRLQRDLVALGVPAHAIDGSPRCEDLPPVATPPHALGCVYVIEGSTLGGRVILRHLTRLLDLHPDRGASFFAGYGEATAARWRETCAALATFDDAPPPSTERAAETAVATFTTLERWLDRRGVLT